MTTGTKAEADATEAMMMAAEIFILDVVVVYVYCNKMRTD